MSGGFDRLDLWPTFVWHGALDLADREIMHLLLEETAIEAGGAHVSNEGGYQSHPLDPYDERLTSFTRHVEAAVSTVVRELGWTGTARANTLWWNANGPGHSNRLHWHPGNDFAAVYYLACDEHTGPLRLRDPRLLRLHTEHDEGWQDRPVEQCPYVAVTPEPGDLVVFPGWLEHEVGRNESTARRVSVATNLSWTRT